MVCSFSFFNSDGKSVVIAIEDNLFLSHFVIKKQNKMRLVQKCVNTVSPDTQAFVFLTILIKCYKIILLSAAHMYLFLYINISPDNVQLIKHCNADFILSLSSNGYITNFVLMYEALMTQTMKTFTMKKFKFKKSTAHT